MDRAAAQRWLDAYVEAWRTYDPALIGELFSDDVEYRFYPAGDPVVGRDAVVRSWREPHGEASTRDEPGTWEAEYEPWAIDGSRLVAVGCSRYFTDASKGTVERVYDNCFLVEFDDQGRCRRFTEFYGRRSTAGD